MFPGGHRTKRSTLNIPQNLRSKKSKKSHKNQPETKKREGKIELKILEENYLIDHENIITWSHLASTIHPLSLKCGKLEEEVLTLSTANLHLEEIYLASLRK